MTESKDERTPLRRFAEAKDEQFYEALGGVLLRLLARKFAVPADDAVAGGGGIHRLPGPQSAAA